MQAAESRKILLPISNLASLCHIWCMPSNSHGSEWTCFQANCLCCSVCANKAYHQHHQADITTLVIMMNLTALNYYIQMYVYCSLFANTSCCKISRKSYYFNSPLKLFRICTYNPYLIFLNFSSAITKISYAFMFPIIFVLCIAILLKLTVWMFY